MTAPLGLAATIVGEALIAGALTGLVLHRFLRSRQPCHLYWGVGLALIAFTMAQEAVFYLGVWSTSFAQAYLVLVALLVGILSLGTAELALRGWEKRLWFGFIGVAGVALVVVGILYPPARSIVVSGVVTGLPPTPVTVVSSIVTVPATCLLVGASVYGAVWQKRYHLLFIAAGTAVIAAAGSLYLASFPLSLYYAEFVGAVLLFFGFVRLPVPALRPAPVPLI